MTTKTFGRRGLAPQVATPAPRISGQNSLGDANATRARAAHSLEDIEGGELFLAQLPILTVGIILLLFFIYGLEQRLAFDANAKGELSVLSLSAFGAASYDLVVRAHEIWRPFLAPLLHASFSHFIGNSFALFFIGLRLEPLIGRSWFAAIFALSAVGGIAGSLIGNPHGVVTVGASGAITGMLSALFVVSFNHRAARHDMRAMRVTALKFGIPALAPLVFGATGHTDYHAHLGGAIAGGVLALTICAIWSDGRFRPDFTGFAAGLSLVGVSASLIASCFAIHGYAAYGAKNADLIPEMQRPANLRVGAAQSAELLAHYPKDPLSHVYRALFLLETRRTFAAEMELRGAVTLSAEDAQGHATRDFAHVVLAIVVAEEGRREEAKGMVRDVCGGLGPAQSVKMLKKAHLCD